VNDSSKAGQFLKEAIHLSLGFYFLKFDGPTRIFLFHIWYRSQLIALHQNYIFFATPGWKRPGVDQFVVNEF